MHEAIVEVAKRGYMNSCIGVPFYCYDCTIGRIRAPAHDVGYQVDAACCCVGGWIVEAEIGGRRQSSTEMPPLLCCWCAAQPFTQFRKPKARRRRRQRRGCSGWKRILTDLLEEHLQRGIHRARTGSTAAGGGGEPR